MDTPSPLAQRITRKLIEETDCADIPEQELLELIHSETKDLRPISSYAQKLKEIINRIIEGGEPELRKIAASLGVSIAE
jgi:hypothetical protein